MLLKHPLNFTRNVCETQAVLKKYYTQETGSGSIKTLNPLFSTICRYYRYQAHLLDKGVASVAAVVELARHFAVLATVAVVEELARHSHCQQATAAEAV